MRKENFKEMVSRRKEEFRKLHLGKKINHK